MKQRLRGLASGHSAMGPRGAGLMVQRATAARAAVALILLGAVAGCGAAVGSHPINSGQSSFSILRSARSANDAIPPWIARRLSESGNPPLLSRTDLREARKVLPHQEGWLVPAGEGNLCLVGVVQPLVPEINGQRLPPVSKRSCASEAKAEAGELFETQSLSTTFAKRLPTRVDGIVPDGVRHVTVHFLGGASRVLPVKRNSYETIVVNPYSLSFVAHRGGRRQRYILSVPTAAGASPAPYANGSNN